MRNLALLCCLLLCLSLTSFAQNPTINGDFNGNGIAGPEDLLELLGSFGQPVTSGSGNLLWAKRAYSPTFDSGNAVAVGSEGKIFITGSFANGALFGEGEPDAVTLTTTNSSNSFLAHYDSSGDFVWVRRSTNSGSGTGSSESGNGVAVRKSDDAIWFTGTFANTATFGIPGATELMVATAGLTDVFVARSSAEGDLEALQRGGGAGVQEGYIVSVLPDGTHIHLGAADTAITFGEGANEITLNSPATRTFYLVKFNPDGTPAWGKSIDSTLFNGLFDGKLLPDGSVLIAAYFDSSIVLGEGEPNETALTPIQSSGGFASDDVLVARFNSDGSLAWARSAGGTGEDRATGLALLPDNSGFIVVGSFEGVATFGAGSPTERILTAVDQGDVYIAKYDLNGQLIWAKSAGGNGRENPFRAAPAPDGSVVVVGTFENMMTLGLGEPNETTLTTKGGTFDSFIAKFTGDGSLLWAKSLGSPGTVIARGVDVDDDGNSVVVGSFTQSITLGEGESGEITLESGGNTVNITAIFLAKFAP